MRLLPSRELPVNTAWPTATAIACDLRAWLQLLSLDGDLAKATPRPCATGSCTLGPDSCAVNDDGACDCRPPGRGPTPSSARLTGSGPCRNPPDLCEPSRRTPRGGSSAVPGPVGPGVPGTTADAQPYSAPPLGTGERDVTGTHSADHRSETTRQGRPRSGSAEASPRRNCCRRRRRRSFRSTSGPGRCRSDAGAAPSGPPACSSGPAWAAPAAAAVGCRGPGRRAQVPDAASAAARGLVPASRTPCRGGGSAPYGCIFRNRRYGPGAASVHCWASLIQERFRVIVITRERLDRRYYPP